MWSEPEFTPGPRRGIRREICPRVEVLGTSGLIITTFPFTDFEASRSVDTRQAEQRYDPRRQAWQEPRYQGAFTSYWQQENLIFEFGDQIHGSTIFERVKDFPDPFTSEKVDRKINVKNGEDALEWLPALRPGWWEKIRRIW